VPVNEARFSLLLLYCCFTAALQLLCCCFAGEQGSARLLLYCCFTAALLLLYCCVRFTDTWMLGSLRGRQRSGLSSTIRLYSVYLLY
jgi:hypothetical protein